MVVKRKIIRISIGLLFFLWIGYILFVPTMLDGTAWRLTKINGKSPVANYPVTMEFYRDEKRLWGDDGCNLYGATYVRVFPGILISETTGHTLMLCYDTARQEEEYLNTLEGLMVFRIQEDRLYLGPISNRDALIFERIPNSEMPHP